MGMGKGKLNGDLGLIPFLTLNVYYDVLPCAFFHPGRMLDRIVLPLLHRAAVSE